MLTVSRFSGATFLQLQPITSAYYYTAFLWNGNSAPTNSDWKRHVTDSDLFTSVGSGDILSTVINMSIGFKSFYFSGSCTNKPASNGGFAYAINSNGLRKIEFTDAYSGLVYSNSYYNGAWLGWK